MSVPAAAGRVNSRTDVATSAPVPARSRRSSAAADLASGRLHARPAPPAAVSATATAGTVELPGGALLHVPARAAVGDPTPLVVLFHGAGSSAHAGLTLLLDLADEAGVMLLAPQARDSTWDLIRVGFGPDVEQLDHVLAHVFARHPVDADRIAFGGFSDGASYALSLGLGNGDLVTHILAFSPGFMAPAGEHGRPPVFITHGTRDAVLPIDRCSRRIVPRLTRAGYRVTYKEFDGGHAFGSALARQALAWLAQGEP